ncbi:hypothetical protein PAHAL_8G262400 [Panicum hallii]|uniref:Uncharacterized protein n=1 Tax=Panicum hallii TaxID=206008 RepID=A0A2T8IAG1_9POAL|nr:hypothetical protein PAHAL_8G262400 [Panicum hallii]
MKLANAVRLIHLCMSMYYETCPISRPTPTLARTNSIIQLNSPCMATCVNFTK